MISKVKVKKTTISAKITRANGQVEDLGVIYQSKSRISKIINKLKNIWQQF